MAKFTLELPNEIVKDIEKVSKNTDKIFGAMTQAGAEVVAQNVRAKAPIPEIAKGVKVSKVYKTPSDDGINTKVYISGYAPFKNGRTSFSRRGRVGGNSYSSTKGVPLGFLAQVYEFGTSPRFTDKGGYRGFIGKKPFFRKGFKKDQIEVVMQKVQEKESGGLLK